jgi:mRNA degradation ribonuclease J1/J2
MSLIEQNESANLESTNIFSLGGIEEIGKNMFIFEHKDEI